MLILALKTLSTFNFAHQDVHLLALIRDVVLLYLAVDSPLIRREAAVTIARTLSRLGSHTRGGKKGELVYFLLKRLVIVAIADPIPVIRLTVLSSLHPSLDHFLSQADLLHSLFVALNDEIFTIRELTISLLGRLSPRNPSHIMPVLRKTLIQLLTSLQQMHTDSVEQEESSKLLSHLITSSHHLIRPYVAPILHVLVPKLTDMTHDRPHSGVGSYVLSTLGDLSVICGDDLLPYLDGLLPLIISTLQDKTSHIRRQVALHTLAQLLSSTGVLSPTLKYPQLMPTVLHQLKVERQGVVRLEVLKVLGIIGALDPLKYRMVQGMTEGSEQEERRKSMTIPQQTGVGVSAQPTPPVHPPSSPLPLSYIKPLDPAASLAQSAKFDLTDATGIQPHEEYYPTIAIASLLRILTDPRLSQHHHMCIKAMMFIYQTLAVKCLPFLPYVLPCVLQQIRTCEGGSREGFLQHLVGIVSIVRAHMRPWVDEMMGVCLEYWDDAALTPTILSLIEHLALSLRGEFQAQLSVLIPKLVSLLQGSSSSSIIRVLHALQVMCVKGCYQDSLHVLIPCLVRLCEQFELSEHIRVESVEALATISSMHSITDHASRLIHPFARMLVASSPTLTDSIMKVLCILIAQLGYGFLVFEPMISSLVRRVEGRETIRYRGLVGRLFDGVKGVREKRGITAGDTMDMLSIHLSFPMEEWKADDAFPSPPPPPPPAEEKEAPPPIKKLHVSQPNLMKAWAASQRSTKDDWVVWMRGFSIELLKESPSSSLRACSALAQKYPPLARELFNAAFLSCWTELFESYQVDLIHSLELTFRSRNIPPEITTTLLNLAEYMEHHDRSLPIDIRTLGDLAQRGHAFAKALHYMEDEASAQLVVQHGGSQPREFVRDAEATIEALIGINNQLQQYDAAHGVLKIAEREGSGVEVKESWYEKLQRWEEALEAYEKKEAERVRRVQKSREEDEEKEDRHERLSRDVREHREHKQRHSEEDVDADVDEDEEDEAERMRRTRPATSLTIRASPPPAPATSPLSPMNLDITLGRLRCLRALGEHDRLFSLASSLWSQTSDPTIHRLLAPLACSACCGLRQWSSLPTFLPALDDSRSMDSLFYSAIHAVYTRDVERANSYIDRCCESIDTSLTALVGESYTRAYRSIVRLQQCMELTEVLQYQQAQRSRMHEACATIRRMWMQRLDHCQRDVEVWQEVLMIRSLVVPPSEDVHTYLDFSSLCRAQGKLHLSLKTITTLLAGVSPLAFVNQPDRPLPVDHPHVTLAAIQHLHATGHQQVAWTRLNELIHSPVLATPAPASVLLASPQLTPSSSVSSPITLSSPTSTPSPSSSSSSSSSSPPALSDALSRLKSVCYLKLGQWQLDMFDSFWDVTVGDDAVRNAEKGAAYASMIPQVLQSFHSATTLDSASYEAWHEWSMINYRIVQHHTNASLLDVTAHVIPAIHGFFRSLYLQAATDGSRQDVLRVLQLWFEWGHRREVEQALLAGMNTISIDTWLAVIPQLIARIHTSSQPIRNLLTELLIRIGKGHPQALVYPLTVASKSPSEARRAASLHVLHSMRQHSSVLVSQASMVSTELVRVAILWHELWHEAIEEASRHWFGNKNADGMYAALLPLHQAMERGPQTTRELNFHTLYSRELQEAYEWLKKYMRGSQPASSTTPAGSATAPTPAAPSSRRAGDASKGGGGGERRDAAMGKAWELYSAVFKKMGKQIGSMSELELGEVSPKLLQARDMQLAVPGSYRVGCPVIRIAYFSPLLRVIESKQHPRRLTIGGSDGHEYPYLLKGHEDLRQDERVMQLFGLVNTLLSSDRTTAKYDLDIRRYEVIPLSPASGLIEWVPNTDPVHHVIKQYRDARNIMLNVEQRLMMKMAPDYATLMLIHKVEVFEYALSMTTGHDLAKVLWLKSPNAEVWLDRRTHFTRSLAVMSMVGYILGLGDRHTCNLMLDRHSGEIVHIDFGDCKPHIQHVQTHAWVSPPSAAVSCIPLTARCVLLLCWCVRLRGGHEPGEVPGEGAVPPHAHAGGRHGGERHRGHVPLRVRARHAGDEEEQEQRHGAAGGVHPRPARQLETHGAQGRGEEGGRRRRRGRRRGRRARGEW